MAFRKYRVAVLGLGPRGHDHVRAFLDNPERFDVVALCDLDSQRLADASARYGIEAAYTDCQQMLHDVAPVIFCFVTPVHIRRAMVEMAAEAGIKAVVFEKPVALTLQEAGDIRSILAENNIRAVVSHQLKYMTAMQKLKAVLDSGAIGAVTHAHATTVPWHMQLGTHFMDYLMWANGGHPAMWAVGHVHGRHHLQAADGHFGPDFLLGEFMLANGVRGILECGYLAPPHQEPRLFWLDDRLTFYGTDGLAWADNTNRWQVISSQPGRSESGADPEDRVLHEERMQSRYMRELADWLDDGAPHPCRFEAAFAGFEALQAIQISALECRRVDLPLGAAEFYDVTERMRRDLPEVPDSNEWLEHGDA